METLYGQSLRTNQKTPDNRLPKIILHVETNEGQRKIGCPRKNFRQCLKEDLKSFKIPVEDFNKIALNRKIWRKLIIDGAQTFQVSWESRRLQASTKRHAHRINDHGFGFILLSFNLSM